jgi:microsomal dipeptidase-like Zn-dependent dipeptidase
MKNSMPYPIFDLHCDLTGYLAVNQNATPNDIKAIGCATPYLKQGNVRLQVMAIYSGSDSTNTQAQCDWFERLTSEYGDDFCQVGDYAAAAAALEGSKTGIVAAVENCSGLCDEDEPLDKAFERFEAVLKATGRILYISLTHQLENRFGGGNMAEAGLKDDGRAMLDYMAGKKIAIDLSHTCDALAYGIIDHIDKHGLDLPMIASHSNMRAMFDFPRNLPDELATEVIKREGLIGTNFVRGFLHPDDPAHLNQHIVHALKLGGQNAICFGADFFSFIGGKYDRFLPIFHPEHENASKYPQILSSLEKEIGVSQVEAMASGNVLKFLERLWV